ncbi:putative lipoprotein [Salinibacter ruber]|nr:putative lipoprotein [Salinibacter ruber]
MKARMSPFGFVLGLASAAMLLTACYSTEGVRIKSMDSEQPYQFSCEAPKSECLEDMKRSLIGSGFEVQEEDMSSGVFVVSKTLDRKEKISTSGFTELTTGTESVGQTGTLSFLFTDTGGESVSIEMEGEVSIEVAESTSETTENQTSTPTRGHPLMVRYGLMLDAAEQITLESPSREKIQEER